MVLLSTHLSSSSSSPPASHTGIYWEPFLREHSDNSAARNRKHTTGKDSKECPVTWTFFSTSASAWSSPASSSCPRPRSSWSWWARWTTPCGRPPPRRRRSRKTTWAPHTDAKRTGLSISCVSTLARVLRRGPPGGEAPRRHGPQQRQGLQREPRPRALRRRRRTLRRRRPRPRPRPRQEEEQPQWVSYRR